MCVDVPSDDVVCEGIKVVEGVRDVGVFCCVVWICGLSWWDVKVRDVNVLVLCQMYFYCLQFCFLSVECLW